jgi:nucleotide-binding universal stress UspA family protein
MTFKRIVVPYEGSLLSEDALRIACRMADEGGTVTAVYVVRTPPSMPIGAEAVADEEAHEKLRRAETIGQGMRARVETYVAKAPDVADGIAETAATSRADAIVMSLRHKHTPEETMVLSHTASRVLREAPCRVLITYGKQEE